MICRNDDPPEQTYEQEQEAWEKSQQDDDEVLREGEECAKCGSVFGPFRPKPVSSGGQKLVCVNRDRCSKRTTGYA